MVARSSWLSTPAMVAGRRPSGSIIFMVSIKAIGNRISANTVVVHKERRWYNRQRALSWKLSSPIQPLTRGPAADARKNHQEHFNVLAAWPQFVILRRRFGGLFRRPGSCVTTGRPFRVGVQELLNFGEKNIWCKRLLQKRGIRRKNHRAVRVTRNIQDLHMWP